ncbi:MAG: acyltransferase family protein [Lachnospiraceae bacterium]|nr:acyltransferase family protein [Lachnospiraceae bacterium]
MTQPTHEVKSAPFGHGRIVYLDILRIAACAAVILFHVSSQFWSVTDRSDPAFAAMRFYDGISLWGVPVFVMISGALLLGRDEPDLFAKTWKKRIPHVLILYAVWGILYGLFSGESSFRELVKAALFGYYHLWYLLMIAGIYCILPLLVPIAKNRKLLRYFILLSFAAAAVRMLLKVPAFSRFGEIWANVHLYFVLGYSVFFLMGYMFHTSETDDASRGRGKRLLLYAAAVLSFIYGIISMDYEYLSLHYMAEAAAVFVFVRTLAGMRSRKAPKTGRAPETAGSSLTEKLSGLTLGIYLIHPMVLQSLDRLFGLNTLSFFTWLSIPVIAAAVFCISALISALLGRIPVLRRLIR